MQCFLFLQSSTGCMLFTQTISQTSTTPQMRNTTFIINPHFIRNLFFFFSVMQHLRFLCSCGCWRRISPKTQWWGVWAPTELSKETGRQTDRQMDEERDGHLSSLTRSLFPSLSVSLSQTASGLAVRYLAFICSDRSASLLPNVQRSRCSVQF